jgi:hypothetical protein
MDGVFGVDLFGGFVFAEAFEGRMPEDTIRGEFGKAHLADKRGFEPGDLGVGRIRAETRGFVDVGNGGEGRLLYF